MTTESGRLWIVKVCFVLLGSAGYCHRAVAWQSGQVQTKAPVAKKSTIEPKTSKDGLGDYVNFPTCGIKIRQPKGLVKSSSFDGFMNEQQMLSVMAVSLSVPISSFADGFDAEEMKLQGWTLRSKQELRIDGLPAVLVHFEQPVRQYVFVKWTLAFGDGKTLRVVTATFPKSREGALSERMKSTVLSTRVDSSLRADPDEGVPFTLTSSPKLKLTRGMNRVLMYTKDGAMGKKGRSDPFFTAVPSLGRVALDSPKALAERRLLGVRGVTQISIRSMDTITINGMKGYEALADAKDEKSGIPMALYQLMLFDNGSYILINGQVGSELADEYLPEFTAMARSVKKK